MNSVTIELLINVLNKNSVFCLYRNHQNLVSAKDQFVAW